MEIVNFQQNYLLCKFVVIGMHFWQIIFFTFQRGFLWNVSKCNLYFVTILLSGSHQVQSFMKGKTFISDIDELYWFISTQLVDESVLVLKESIVAGNISGANISTPAQRIATMALKIILIALANLIDYCTVLKKYCNIYLINLHHYCGDHASCSSNVIHLFPVFKSRYLYDCFYSPATSSRDSSLVRYLGMCVV